MDTTRTPLAKGTAKYVGSPTVTPPDLTSPDVANTTGSGVGINSSVESGHAATAASQEPRAAAKVRSWRHTLTTHSEALGNEGGDDEEARHAHSTQRQLDFNSPRRSGATSRDTGGAEAVTEGRRLIDSSTEDDEGSHSSSSTSTSLADAQQLASHGMLSTALHSLLIARDEARRKRVQQWERAAVPRAEVSGSRETDGDGAAQAYSRPAAATRTFRLAPKVDVGSDESEDTRRSDQHRRGVGGGDDGAQSEQVMERASTAATALKAHVDFLSSRARRAPGSDQPALHSTAASVSFPFAPTRAEAYSPGFHVAGAGLPQRGAIFSDLGSSKHRLSPDGAMTSKSASWSVGAEADTDADSEEDAAHLRKNVDAAFDAPSSIICPVSPPNATGLMAESPSSVRGAGTSGDVSVVTGPHSWRDMGLGMLDERDPYATESDGYDSEVASKKRVVRVTRARERRVGGSEDVAQSQSFLERVASSARERDARIAEKRALRVMELEQQCPFKPTVNTRKALARGEATPSRRGNSVRPAECSVSRTTEQPPSQRELEEMRKWSAALDGRSLVQEQEQLLRLHAEEQRGIRSGQQLPEALGTGAVAAAEAADFHAFLLNVLGPELQVIETPLQSAPSAAASARRLEAKRRLQEEAQSQRLAAEAEREQRRQSRAASFNAFLLRQKNHSVRCSTTAQRLREQLKPTFAPKLCEKSVAIYAGEQSSSGPGGRADSLAPRSARQRLARSEQAGRVTTSPQPRASRGRCGPSVQPRPKRNTSQPPKGPSATDRGHDNATMSSIFSWSSPPTALSQSADVTQTTPARSDREQSRRVSSTPSKSRMVGDDNYGQFSFSPSITQHARDMEGRSVAAMHLDAGRRDRYLQEMREKKDSEIMKQYTFRPQLNDEFNANVQSMLHPRCLSAFQQYTARRQMQRTAAREAREVAVEQEAIRQCTFRPKINAGVPSYISRMAADYAQMRRKGSEEVF